MQPWEINIRWAWYEFSIPREQRCKDAVINGIKRGNMTAHDCVVACINAWVMNHDFQTAIAWLSEGSHCHDAAAAANFRQNAGAAVTHAVQVYGPQLGFFHDKQNIEELSKI